MPREIASLLMVVALFMLVSMVLVIVAQRGAVNVASVVWLCSLVAAILAPAIREFDLRLEQTMIALIIPILAAGLVISPIMSLITACVIAALEIALVLILHPAVRHDLLAGAILITLSCGLINWLFALSLHQALHQSDILRHDAESLRDLSLDLARQHADHLKEEGIAFKTRLELASGYVRLLEQNYANVLDGQGREALRTIRDNLREMIRRGQFLLDVAWLQGSRSREQSTVFGPSDLLLKVVEDYSPLAEHKGLRFRCLIVPHVPDQVIGDPVGLHHALGLVLGHAIRCTHQGLIDVYAWRPDVAHWAVRVSDSSPGLSRAARVRVFEPFYQVAPSITSSYYGSEVGLALARELVEAMGGVLTIDSSAEAGTRATITLPLQLPSSPDLRQA